MNRNDLEDLLEFDKLTVGLGGIGMFLLSGAIWLGVEKLLELEELEMNPLLWLCALCVLFGLVFLYIGNRMRERKRSRIERIFQETEPQPFSKNYTSAGSPARQA